jgi:hypothetical protein
VEEHCDHHTGSQISPIYLTQTGRISLFRGHDYRDDVRNHGHVLYHVLDPGDDHGLIDLILFSISVALPITISLFGLFKSVIFLFLVNQKSIYEVN